MNVIWFLVFLVTALFLFIGGANQMNKIQNDCLFRGVYDEHAAIGSALSMLMGVFCFIFAIAWLFTS